MFVGSCFGVILLVVLLELLGRLQREFDRYIRRRDQIAARRLACDISDGECAALHQHDLCKSVQAIAPDGASRLCDVEWTTLVQRQAIRAAIHMVQFAVAYFIMLLAMYFNGELDENSKFTFANVFRLHHD